MKHLKYKSLTQRGIIHHIIPIVAFVILFGAIGGYFIFASHAASTNVNVIKSQLGNYCITSSGSSVGVAKCDGDNNQRWVLSGNIKDSAISKCLQAASSKSGGQVQAVACGQAHEGWSKTTKYSGLQASNGLCLAVPAGNTSANLEAVACNVKTYDSQNWTLTTVSVTTGGGGGSSTLATEVCNELNYGKSSDACNSVGIAVSQVASNYSGWNNKAELVCLGELWNQESTWNRFAKNPSSGAYGIPQALPASKMGAAANPPQSSAAAQIKWGLSYIKGRYNTPCGAETHEKTYGWYGIYQPTTVNSAVQHF